MTPKALVSLLSFAILPATFAQNPSRAKHEPGEHRHFQTAVTVSSVPAPPSAPPTGPVVPLPVLSMKMLSPSNGWASNGSQLFFTTDNGADWNDISPATTAGDIYAGVFFLDSRTGWLLTAHSDDLEDWAFDVWRTCDGGETWEKARLPRWRRDEGHAARDLAGRELANRGTITFADERRGWLSLDLKGNTLFGTSTLLVTFDGGRSWDWAPDGPDGHISGMTGAGDSLFTVGQSHGASDLETSGNGLTGFVPVSLPVPVQIAVGSIPTYSLPIFADAKKGTEVVRYRSANGTTTTAVLYSTSNGGRTWHADGILKNLLGSEDVHSTLADSTWILPLEANSGPATLIELATGTTGSLPSHQSGDFGRCTLSFLTRLQGWSDCAGDLTATNDGGATWSEISPRASNGILTSYPMTPAVAAPPLVASGSPTTHVSLTRAVSQHLGFDSAILPDSATMKTWWQTSPYYDVGIYAPGAPNGPNGPAPDAAWVNAVSQQGWGIIPIWAGLQSPCGCDNPPSGPHAHDRYPECHQLAASQRFSIKPAEAEQQGEAQAQAAFNSVRSIGLDGAVIYVGIEGYDANAHGEHNLSCGAAAEAYVAGWTKRMHQDGGAGSAGVYGALRDAAPETSPQQTGFEGADSIFVARDDNRVTVWGLNHDSESQLDDSLWPVRQRIHQFRSGAQESWGGASLYVDSNVEDAAVAGGNNVKPIVPTTVSNIGFGPNSYLTGVADGANRGVLVAGQVLGVSYTGGAWSDGTSFTFAPAKSSPTGGATPIVYGAISTVAFAINNLGQVVGYYRNLPTDIGHGFLYTPGQGFKNFDVAGANWTELYSINDAGWILGGYANSEGGPHCALFKPPYTAPILFDDPGGNCFSTGINGLGQITGAYPTDPSQTAFIPFVNDAQSAAPGNTANYQQLSTPSIYTFPEGINNNGIVTGEDANLLAGFFVDPRNSDSYATLPVLPNTSESTLLGVNDNVQTAGWIYTNQSQGILLDTAH